LPVSGLGSNKCGVQITAVNKIDRSLATPAITLLRTAA
jgi:hypothetical protein